MKKLLLMVILSGVFTLGNAQTIVSGYSTNSRVLKIEEGILSDYNNLPLYRIEDDIIKNNNNVPLYRIEDGILKNSNNLPLYRIEGNYSQIELFMIMIALDLLSEK